MRKNGKLSSTSQKSANGSASDIAGRMEDGTVDRAVARAVREAVLQHKKLGNPIAVWRKGKVVWLKPEEI